MIAAPPAMSSFIVSIPLPVLSESPPESKVIPLPISATFFCALVGGAAIIGAMSRLPELRPAVEVTGYIPTTDNLPSGSAQKPGDIIRYLNGKTIEVLNTDAEGRLILADGLALAAKEKPDCMVNLATLTGACMVARLTMQDRKSRR